MTDYTRNVSSSSSNNMHHVSSSSNNGGRPVSILPNMSIQNMSNWSNLMNMNMANMANMNNMNYPMMRPSFTVKQRKTNFTQREVDALINSVRKHQDTVLFGVAGGPGWAKAWTQVAAAVSAVEGIVRSEGDVRKKWTYLKWEAKNTSKPDRDSTSRAVLQILTSRQNQIDAANHHAANLRADMRVNDVLRGESLREAVQSSRSLLEELLGEFFGGGSRAVFAVLSKAEMEGHTRRVGLKRGCYGQYTKEQMLAAIQSYQSGYMGLNAAAKLFNIPRATLRRKVEGLPVIPVVDAGMQGCNFMQVPPQPGTNAVDGSPQPQPSASAGRPPAQVKQQHPQLEVKREPMSMPSPRERPSPSSHPPTAMPTPTNHPAAPAGAGLPPGIPHPHPQLPPPRRSAPLPMRPPSPSLPPQPAAPPPEVCLRWNSYHSNMQATFPSLLNNEQFVDVTLACEGHSIKCHKVMLSACSSYFEELLSQNPCQHPIVLMKDLRFWEVQALVDFMYRGEVNVTQDKLPSLLAAAEALQIKGLAGPATNNDSEAPRGNYNEGGPRQRKRARQMPDHSEQTPRNPVGRPRIHPKVPQRPQAPPAALPSPLTPRVQMRPDLQRPIQLDDGPPAQRMKPSPPVSPSVKLEPLEMDLSNDSMDKMRYEGGDSGRYDGGDSGGSGDGSNHGDALVDLSQGRYGINNGLQSDRNRDHSDNEHDDDRHLDDEEEPHGRDQDHQQEQARDRGQENDRREHHDLDALQALQDNEQDDDNDMDQDNDNDNDRDNDQALTMANSEDEQDIHSSDEDQYDNEPQQDSRHQSDHLPDHLLGRL